MMTGVTNLIITIYKCFLENLPFGCSISSMIHFGFTSQPTKIVEKIEIYGIRKLLLI